MKLVEVIEFEPPHTSRKTFIVAGHVVAIRNHYLEKNVVQNRNAYCCELELVGGRRIIVDELFDVVAQRLGFDVKKRAT